MFYLFFVTNQTVPSTVCDQCYSIEKQHYIYLPFIIKKLLCGPNRETMGNEITDAQKVPNDFDFQN